MSKYIVKNCPGLFNDNIIPYSCVREHFNKSCKDVTDCVIKKLINGVELESQIPKDLRRFELDYGAVCAKNHMAHLVLTSLGVEEVE